MARIGDGDVTSIDQSKLIFTGGGVGNRFRHTDGNLYATHPAAMQSGIVQLKVYINRTCPFNKGLYFDDSLYFNSSTLKGFAAGSPLLRHITATPGAEGVYLKPEYNYRHNFIEAPTVDESVLGSTDPSVFLNAERFEPLISPIERLETNPPNYKPEHTWLIVPSVFSSSILPPSEYLAGKQPGEGEEGDDPFGESCKSNPIWVYETFNMPSTRRSGTLSQSADDLEEETKQTTVLMPKQIGTSLCRGRGVHWRVLKKTNLFEGEDFFVEFHKRAFSTDIQPDDTSEWVNDTYRALDSLSAAVARNPITGRDEFINQGVTDYEVTLDDADNRFLRPVDPDSYDFRSQAYYVVETGIGTADQHYLFIICQNGKVRCVLLQDGFSRLISEFDGSFFAENNESAPVESTGQSLLSADSFRMTVRNHLGKFVVTLETPGYKSSPWIISRFDPVPSNGVGDSGEVAKIMKTKGGIALWGGNMVSGFFFSPLQYTQIDDSTGVSIDLPAKTSNLGLDAQSFASNCKRGVPEDVFSLPNPDNVSHNISFSVTNHEVESLPNDGTMRSGPFYTCDAQEVEEISGESLVTSFPSFMGQGFLRQPSLLPSKLSVKKEGRCITQDQQSEIFRLRVTIRAGNHRFPSGYILPRCKTPIMTHLRLLSDPEDAPRWDTSQSIDATDHVLSFDESWSASDFTKIEHTGRIKFLLNDGANYENNNTEAIESLRNKNFYIEVYAGYRDCNYSQLNQLFKLFTGICEGGSVSFEIGQKIMECQIQDYSVVLQNQVIFNSPFYDGVTDTNAIFDLLRMAGFRYQQPDHPGNLVRQSSESAGEEFLTTGLDGRPVEVKKWSLPTAYATLTEPYYKFEDGSTLLDAIMKICKGSSKVFFFDSYGVAHYDNYRDTVASFIINGIPPRPVFYYTTNQFYGQKVFNTLTFQFDMASVYSHIKLITNTPGYTPIVGDDVNWPALDNPSSEGFVGYLKTWYQREGAFGSIESAQDIVNYYKAFYKPPFVTKFETYGQPVRALDIVALNGQPLRVIKVDSTIDGSKNLWWQTIECEWLQPLGEDALPDDIPGPSQS